MGFTVRTHPELEALVSAQLSLQAGLRNFDVEAAIANLMEQLFLPPVEASGSGSRYQDRPGAGVPIPGAWKNV